MDLNLEQLPKATWWLIGAVVVVVLALVMRQRAASTLDATGGAGVSPGADPNVEATNQAMIAAKTSAFEALSSGAFGLESNVVTGARDTNIAALAANAQGAQDLINGNVAAINADYQYQAGVAANARDVTLAGYARDVAFGDQSTTRAVAGISATTQQNADALAAATAAGQTNAAASTAATLAAYEAATAADTNRTNLAIAQSQQTTQRQAGVAAAGSSSSGVWGAVAAAIPWLLSFL